MDDTLSQLVTLSDKVPSVAAHIRSVISPKLLAVNQIFKRYGQVVSPDHIGRFEEAKPILLAYLLNSEAEIKFYDFFLYGELFNLDQNQVMAMLFDPETFETMQRNPVLKARSEDFIG